MLSWRPPPELCGSLSPPTKGPRSSVVYNICCKIRIYPHANICKHVYLYITFVRFPKYQLSIIFILFLYTYLLQNCSTFALYELLTHFEKSIISNILRKANKQKRMFLVIVESQSWVPLVEYTLKYLRIE